MYVEVRRNPATKRSTTGRMAVNGQPQCVTLEPPSVPNPAPNGNGYVCISAGTFPLTIQWSTKFQKMVPHINDVPNRTAIEMHIGNYPTDTDGCTCVGTDYGDPPQPDYIRFSSKAFVMLIAKLFAGAILTNPDAAEIDQVWNVGTVTYIDAIGG